MGGKGQLRRECYKGVEGLFVEGGDEHALWGKDVWVMRVGEDRGTVIAEVVGRYLSRRSGGNEGRCGRLT